MADDQQDSFVPDSFVPDEPSKPQTAPPDSFAADKPSVKDALKSEVDKLPGPTQMPSWQSYLPAAGATLATTGLRLAALDAGPPGWIALALAGGLGAGAGSLAKQAVDQQGVPKDPGDALKQAGWDATVQGLAPELVGSATGAVLAKYFNPERQYQLALRPQGETTEAEKAIQGGLKGKIGLGWDTPAARAKNEARGNAIDADIDKAINSVPGGALPAQQWTATVQNKLDAVRAKWIMDPLNRRSNLKQIDDAEWTFLRDHGNPQPITRTGLVNGKQATITVQPDDMNLQELRGAVQDLPYTRAQAIKQASYRTTRSNRIAAPAAFDPNVQPGLDVENRGAITSALREDLENSPGLEALKTLNRDSGESQALDKAIEKFARRLPALKGFGNAVAGGMGGFLMGHSPESIAMGVGAGMLNYLRTDPAVRSRLAIALYAARGNPLARAAFSQAGRAAVRLPFTAGKIIVDANKAKQAPPELQSQIPQQAKGGKAKSDDYLRQVERRAYSREAILNGLRN